MIGALLTLVLAGQSPSAVGPAYVLGKADGGTLPVASTVPGGLIYETGSGSLYYSNGTTWNPIASSTAGWTTALDCDLSAQGNVALDAGNGDYSICGVAWTQFNATNFLNRPALVSGTGLVLQPVQVCNWYGTVTTAPGFYIPLTTLIPIATPTTRIRISMAVTGNWSANYHSVRFGFYSIMSGTTYGWFGSTKGIDTAVSASPLWALDWSTGQAASTSGGGGAAFTSQQVTLMEYPDGIAGGQATVSVDYYDGGAFPPTAPYTLGTSQPTTDKVFYTSSGFDSVRFYIAAQRDGAAATFTANVIRVKVEYRP